MVFLNQFNIEAEYCKLKKDKNFIPENYICISSQKLLLDDKLPR